MTQKELLKGIGLNIKRLRGEKKVQQQDLAAVCNFEKSSMSRIEAGGTNLTVGTLLKISEALDVEIVDLIKIL